MTIGYTPGKQGFLRFRPFGQKLWSDIFPFTIGKFSHLKADAAVFHHSEKDFLLFGRVVRPDEYLKFGPHEASVALEQGQDFLSVEECIDGLQSPILIE